MPDLLLFRLDTGVGEGLILGKATAEVEEDDDDATADKGTVTALDGGTKDEERVIRIEEERNDNVREL